MKDKTRDKYDKLLFRWVKNHYWDSLEKDKDLLLRHLRTFIGDKIIHNDSRYGKALSVIELSAINTLQDNGWQVVHKPHIEDWVDNEPVVVDGGEEYIEVRNGIALIKI